MITIEMDAHYQLVPNKKEVTVACCDVYRMRGNKVSEWRIYADMSPCSDSQAGNKFETIPQDIHVYEIVQQTVAEGESAVA